MTVFHSEIYRIITFCIFSLYGNWSINHFSSILLYWRVFKLVTKRITTEKYIAFILYQFFQVHSTSCFCSVSSKKKWNYLVKNVLVHACTKYYLRLITFYHVLVKGSFYYSNSTEGAVYRDIFSILCNITFRFFTSQGAVYQ